jgi:hypothetical protein
MDKYSITLSDGGWTYAPRSEKDTSPWSLGVGFRYASPPCRTPADFRACADVVQRWHADHAPKRRRRVVRVGDRYYARHETLDGWMWDFAEDSARAWAKVQTTFGSVPATDEVIDALLSLRDNPNEEVPNGE